MDLEQMQRLDRYENRRERIRRVAELMHHNMAPGCCLDSLDRAIRALEGAALRGERVGLAHAQGKAADLRRPAPAAEEGGGPQARADDAEGAGRRGVTAGGAGEREADAAEAGAAEAGAAEAGAAEAGAAGAAAGEPLRQATAGGEEPAAPIRPDAAPPAPAAALTVKQKPPVAKPGRARGWAPGAAKAKAKAKPKPGRNVPNRPAPGPAGENAS